MFPIKNIKKEYQNIISNYQIIKNLLKDKQIENINRMFLQNYSHLEKIITYDEF